MIEHGTGNLLDAPVEALVNTVNCVGVMGKGLALQFRKAWPAMYEAYRTAAERGEVRVGRMHVFETGTLVGPRLIINFPTKRHWRSPSRLEDIEVGMKDLVQVLRARDVRSVAIPSLGAGLGGLDWQSVRPVIVEALSQLPDLQVLLWEPGNAPPPTEQPVNTRRPRLTPTKAAVLALMDRYCLLDHAVTHLEAQKLAYFLERAGGPGDFRFQPHLYGPYSDRLFHMLRAMEGHQLHGLEDRDPSAPLTLNRDSVEEAEAFLERDTAARGWFERVSRLVEGFQTPYGMEMLATVDWLAREYPEAAEAPERCHQLLGQWPQGGDRKMRLMKPDHLAIAWKRLATEGWLGGRGTERQVAELCSAAT